MPRPRIHSGGVLRPLAVLLVLSLTVALPHAAQEPPREAQDAAAPQRRLELTLEDALRMAIENNLNENRFVYCEWSWSEGDPGCLTVDDSYLELESCVLRDIDGEGVHATGSTTRIRRCLTERTREALSLDSGDTLVEYCTIRNAIGDSDLIDTNDSDPPARILFNHIYGTEDDGMALVVRAHLSRRL